MKVLNINLKKFKNMVKKRCSKINVLQLQKMESRKEPGMKFHNPHLRRILRKYDCIFCNLLPHGLPPKINVDHEIETDKNGNPPYRPLYQLSSVELRAMNGYVQKLLSKGKIWPSKSPSGAPIFFVKDED